MFKNLNKIIKESQKIKETTSLDLYKPGEVGKIILYNKSFYIYDGSDWVLFNGKVNKIINILQNPLTFGGLQFVDTLNGITKYKKPNEAESWAGVTFFKNYTNLITPDVHKISVYVKSPKINVPIMLKIEDKNESTISQEIIIQLVNKDTLTKLTFDFNGTTGNTFDKVTIFFDYSNVSDDSIYEMGKYSFD